MIARRILTPSERAPRGVLDNVPCLEPRDRRSAGTHWRNPREDRGIKPLAVLAGKLPVIHPSHRLDHRLPIALWRQYVSARRRT
jgi:hypothetical protein